MSQTTTADESETDDEQTQSDWSVAPVLVEELAYLRDLLESVGADDIERMADDELVDVRSELKELEDAVEDTRKSGVEDELEDRVDPGERLHGLHRIESHNKYVAEDVGTVIGRLVNEGVDYTEYVDLNASALADSDLDVQIGRYEYTYFR